ncbi:hypothetical protein [Chryseobacterium glaciei]|nr:hypothetical protein [Chryseobacterium glaciei]
MDKVLLLLPVPKYLKRVLEKKYGEYFQATETTLLGFTVLQILKRKSEIKYDYIRQNQNDYFRVYIGVRKAVIKGFIFNQKRSHQLAKTLERQTKEELFTTTILNKENYGIEYQVTLLNFLDFYDIPDEELTYETLRKDFNRQKLKLIQKLKINYTKKGKKNGIL